MKLRYLFSLVGSFFLSLTARSQETAPIKKETQPQVKSNPDGQSLPITVKPSKDTGRDDKSLPITVKPEKHKDISEKHKNVSEKHIGVTNSSMTVMPGSVLFATQFESDEIGEMPAGWKSNGIGSVVKVEGREGNWLKIDESTTYETSYQATLPTNYKIEFDYIANFKSDQAVPELMLRVYTKGNAYTEPGVKFLISPNGGSAGNPTRIQVSSYNAGGSEKFSSTARHLPVFETKNGKNEPVHVVIAIKGEQVKAWLDGEKVYDLQEVVPTNAAFNRIAFETGNYGGPRENYSYFISNVKVVAQ